MALQELPPHARYSLVIFNRERAYTRVYSKRGVAIASLLFIANLFAYIRKKPYLCSVKETMRDIWLDYRSEVWFGLILSVLLVLSAWLSHFIPAELFDRFLNPALSLAFAAICFFGAVLCIKHHEGIAVRKRWAYMLIAWGIWEIVMVVASATINSAIMELGTDTMSGITMVLACLFAWLLFIYPTDVLRPGWLNWTHTFLQLFPLLILGLLDYFVPADLRWLIGLYPIGLLLLLIRHVHAYRRWCEDNFSTMDDIDVQWIVRYLMMVVLSGVVFYWLCLGNLPTRAFTQQWYLAFVLVYTTERILYRPDPQKRLKENNPAGAAGLTTESAPTGTKSAVLKLEQWLEKEKPYLNPDFQLADLRQVLPLNRTYLSQLINSEYGCSFYQWVNSLRVKEAMRLLSENPDMKIQDIAERCGFSSRRVFTQIFTRETGTTPSEWVTAQNNPQ